MIEIPYSPHFAVNLSDHTRHHDALPCAVCGKAVSKPKWWVHVHLGGSHIINAEEASSLDLSEEEDMGYFPLGSNCYRRHPELRPYATESDLSVALSPPLILIVSDVRAGNLSASEAAIIAQCEAAYHRGHWYVTVPAELALRLPQMEVQA